MIKYVDSFLDEAEINYFISLIDTEPNKYHEDSAYKFYYRDIKGIKLQTDKFSNFKFKKLRVQMVNENIKQITRPHGHVNPWSFVIFLNENFKGGELIFGNRVFEPKKGDMVYFTGEERHSVNDCIGNRYTLVGFMHNNPLNVALDSYGII